MDTKENFYNTRRIRRIADIQLLDKTKRTKRLPSNLNHKDSRDETSDRDSDSNDDFIALPQEFRPNLKPCPQKQTKDGNTSLNQTIKNQSNESSASKNPTENFSEKRTFLDSSNQKLSLQKEENSIRHDSSILKTGPQFKIGYQILNQDNFHQKDKGKISGETSENASKAQKSLSRQRVNLIKDVDSIRQQRNFLLENENRNKKPFEYQHVQTKEMQTIQLNFDNLSLKDTDSVLKEGLKYETRLTRKSHTNPMTTTHGENRITKQNTKKRSSLSDGQFSVSSERNIIKWDSSLKLNEDNKIEYRIISEKTSLTVRKKVTNSQFNNLISEDCHTNRGTIKNSHRKKSNNYIHKKANSNNHTKSTAIKKLNVTHEKSSNSKNFELKPNLISNVKNSDYTRTIINSDSSSHSGTEECICSKHQSAGNWKNVENRQIPNSLYRTSVSEPNKRDTVDRRKKPLLTENQNENEFSLLHQVKNDLRFPSHYNFRNSPLEATVESNICNNNDHKQPLSFQNKEQTGFSQLQQGENSLNMAAYLNFTQRENSNQKISKDLEDKKESILQYGKDISDLIVGSYIALTMFFSFYREWATVRKELIRHFEELKQQLKESSTKYSKFSDIIQIAKSGAAIATAIPHPVTSMAAKVVTVITSLLQTFLNKKSDTSNIDDCDETTRAMLKDNRSSSELYMYGLQCSQQFEETTKLIEEFHSKAETRGVFDRENPEIITFLQGFLELKPNHRTFYKKLHKCFQELLQHNNTNFSKKFCEPFTLYSSSAVDVIGHLRWRFRNEDFDGSSVRFELEEIQRLIQNNSSISLNDLQKRIQSCIGILTDELEFIDSRMKDIAMFNNSMENDSVK